MDALDKPPAFTKLAVAADHPDTSTECRPTCHKLCAGTPGLACLYLET